MTYYGTDRKVYLLTFNGLRDPVQRFLDTRPEVLNWFSVLSNGILIVSRSDATVLSTLIHNQFPSLWFILTHAIPSETNGWMNPQAWDFINNPRSSGRWEP